MAFLNTLQIGTIFSKLRQKIGDADDVSIDSPAANEILKYDSNNEIWINSSITAVLSALGYNEQASVITLADGTTKTGTVLFKEQSGRVAVVGTAIVGQDVTS